MATAHINDAQFEAEVLQSSIPVLVDFYAEWCGPCKMAAPVLDELSVEFKDKVKIVKVDVDANQIAGQYGVMSIPTVIMFNQGKEVDRKIGFGGKDGYLEMIKKQVK